MNAPVHVDAHGSRGHYHVRPPALLLVGDSGASELAPSGPSRWRPALEPETVSDWCHVHERIVGLGAERAAHERELGRWLRAAERLGVHARTGFSSLHEYAERILGLTGRQLEERLRVARALDELPLLDQALASGALCWSAVRELSRVATAETEQAWLDWAKGRRSRQIEQAVAERRRGDRPHDRPDPSQVKHRLRFEVRPETMALFRDLQARVRAELGGAADDDALLYEIARRALGGPGDEGRASYQMAVTRCPECGLASVDAGGQSYPVSEAVAEMAACDGQHLGTVEGDGASGPRLGAPDDCPHAGAADESSCVSVRGDGPHAGASSDHSAAAAPGDGPHAGASSDYSGAAASGDGPHVGAADESSCVGARGDCPHDVGASTGNSGAAAPGDRPHAGAVAPVVPKPRATQSIPPALRRQIMRRDHKRCAVEGCENHLFLDVHHTTPRAEGGRHEPDTLLSLCGVHHRAVHAGTLVIGGTAQSGFTFRHADGTAYGKPLHPSTVELAEQVFGALRTLGFPHTRARALVDTVLRDGAPGDPAAFLRAALLAT